MKGGADIVFGEGSRCCNLGERERANGFGLYVIIKTYLLFFFGCLQMISLH